MLLCAPCSPLSKPYFGKLTQNTRHSPYAHPQGPSNILHEELLQWTPAPPTSGLHGLPSANELHASELLLGEAHGLPNGLLDMDNGLLDMAVEMHVDMHGGHIDAD